MTHLVKTRTLKGVVAATLAGLMLAALPACANEAGGEAETSASPSTAAAAWPREVNDDSEAGSLTLEAQPSKIVSTSVTLTGTLLSLDAPVKGTATTGPDVPGLTDEHGFFTQWADEATKAGVAPLYSISDDNVVEPVAEAEPDLIVVSKTGGDSAMDSVEQLKQIAPVVVIDYLGSSWQDVTEKLGKIVGREDKAAEVIADFDGYLKDAKAKIEVPSDSLSPFIVSGDKSGLVALTKEAPQSQLLEQMGFTLTEVPADISGGAVGNQKGRKDTVVLSAENTLAGLPGKLWLAVSANPDEVEYVKTSEAYASADAVKSGKVYSTSPSTFRFDYYSAKIMVDDIVKQFAK